ncbi:hypothetical protein [Williamsia muralis]|uniref:hypothetical protein n=1 Tax=Williamsia marianensis TaxID=85044 RepID=UPI00382D8862
MTGPTSEAVEAKWLEIAPFIDRLAERVADRDDFVVEPNSPLAQDDAATSPYHLSHCLRMCITAGVDHLSAIKQLIIDGQVLHVSAPFTLARGALEVLSAAYWILHPDSQTERIQRVLRWHAKNFNDQHTALSAAGVEQSPTRNEKLRKLYTIADTRSIPHSRVKTGYTSSDAVRYADERSSVSVLFAWQLCSGFAHGRPWRLWVHRHKNGLIPRTQTFNSSA